MNGEVKNVIEMYIMAASIFLLAITLAFLPFHLTGKGKAIVFVSGVGISLLAYISIPMFSYWAIFPIAVVLAALVSYVVMTNVDIFHTHQVHKGKANQSMVPLFSYAELKEKAEQAETIDQYYMDFTQLADEPDVMMAIEIVKEPPSERVGQDEINMIIKKQLAEAAVAIDSAKDSKMDIADPKLSTPSSKIDVAEIDIRVDQREEISLLDAIEKNPILTDQLEEITIDNEVYSIEDENVLTDQSEFARSAQNDPEILKADMPTVEDRQADLLSHEPQVPEFSLEEIDYGQREIASSIEFQDERMAETDLSAEEVDLIEIRKRLFAGLDEEVLVAATLESLQPEEQSAKVEAKPFLNQKLEAPFDDLEELYLKKKANEQQKEEPK